LRDAPNGTKIGSIHANTYLNVVDQQGNWYKVNYYGQYGWVTSNPNYVTVVSSTNQTQTSVTEDTYVNDPNAPYIGTTVYSKGQNSDAIRWVQTNLKATGRWYQGDQWRITGHLGDHTMQEIRSFMQSMGYTTHTGVVDQTVINALCRYMDNKTIPADFSYTPSSQQETMKCWECGGTMTKKREDMGYTSDATGHCHDYVTIYTCMNCGNRSFEGAPGEGTWTSHSFNRNGICTVCGYDRGD
jgi:hypothetical protein